MADRLGALAAHIDAGIWRCAWGEFEDGLCFAGYVFLHGVLEQLAHVECDYVNFRLLELCL